MDPFAIVLIVGLAALVGWVWILGTANQGASMEQLGLRTGRQITESREALEAEDLQQMLAASNERRRRRGERDLTLGDLEARVMSDFAENQRRRESYLASAELDELLEATNSRRRARGLPERTREQARQEFGSERDVRSTGDSQPG
jgi:hypothetical protein